MQELPAIRVSPFPGITSGHASTREWSPSIWLILFHFIWFSIVSISRMEVGQPRSRMRMARGVALTGQRATNGLQIWNLSRRGMWKQWPRQPRILHMLAPPFSAHPLPGKYRTVAGQWVGVC